MEASRSRLTTCIWNILLSRCGGLRLGGLHAISSATLLCCLSFLVLCGCAPALPKGEKSILIISIPNFRADDLGCGSSSDSITPQLDIICGEGVRFTHAYTPSVLVVPALASILTGLYPFEHGIHRNDASEYASGVKSLPEWAREHNYETFFVSGGVPLLKKTGVEKGFADFEDSVRNGDNFYRPADETVKRFLSLLENRGEGSPFLAVIALADLSFPEVISLKTGQSEKREGMYNGKLQEIDEAIGGLRSEFKKMKIWDQLTVVIVGLQGTTKGEHEGLSKGLSLYDEITRVPLLIKPSRKPRDEGPSWKVDEPVSLVDLGVTLLKILGPDKNELERFKKSSVPLREFTDAIEAKEFHDDGRPLFCESDLPPWRGWGPRLVSMRKGEWVYWPSPEEKLFDTYSDRLELRNVYSMDFNAFHAMDSLWSTFASRLVEKSENTPHFLPVSVGEKMKAAQIVFSRVSESKEKLRALVDLEMRRPDDWQIIQWHVHELTEAQDWTELKNLLTAHRPQTPGQVQEYKIWQTFLRIKLRTKIHDKEVIDDPSENCLFLALALKHFNIQEMEYFQTQQACKDHETQAWVSSFIHYKTKKMKEANAFFEMARALTEKRLDQTEFARYFWLDGAVWDFQKELPGGPSIFELFNALVSNQEFLSYIKKKQIP